MMRIGNYQLKNCLLLAPMAGVTDRPFRMLCKRYGASLAASEMITADKTLWTRTKTLRRADHRGESGPIAVQIAGADPQQMAEAARINVERGAQIIDINMGCPVKKVCNVAAGSALLRDESLVARILDAVVNAVDVPVTLKTRLGWDATDKNILSIARLAQQTGIAALALHGRTREQLYSGDVDYDTIAEVKQHIAIPLIANGDIDSPQKAAWVLQHTKADGIMIGRAAQGRPWLFAQIEHYLETGTLLPTPDTAQIGTLLLEHLESLYRFYGEYSGCRIARKHIAWFTNGLHGANAFRQAVYQLESTAAQHSAVSAFFDGLTHNKQTAVTQPLA